MENDVLKVFNIFPAPDTSISDLEGRVGTLFMPDSSKGSVQGSLSVFLLALPIELELPVGRGREAESQALEMRSGARHLGTQHLS
eukprot:219115-Amphidinium_carterae.1